MPSEQDDLSFDSAQDRTLRERMTALNASSSRWAEERGAEQFDARIYLLRPLRVFCRVYVRQGGWRQGTRGLIAAIIEMYEAFVSAAKLWEKRQVKSRAAKLKR